MATITERYAVAINAKSLVVDERTTFADSDVLGAMGLAAKHLAAGWVTTGPDEGYPIREAPLAVPLQRLLSGDNKASHEVVGILAGMVWSRAAGKNVKPKVTRVMAHDMARGCLAWHRHSACKACGGHGKLKIPGTNVLGDKNCQKCFDRTRQESTGRIPFETQFRAEHVDLARWLLAEMERALGRAGPEAMKAIAQRMEL
jgi:hypothetical protein